MKINNVTEISPDDFDADDRATVGKIAEILNPFMQQVVELADGRIDYDNMVQAYIEVEMTVDSSGTPILNNKIKTNKTYAKGLVVIGAFNLTDNNVYPTAQPFISFTQLAGGFVQVNNIRGLQANNKYKLNIEVK